MCKPTWLRLNIDVHIIVKVKILAKLILKQYFYLFLALHLCPNLAQRIMMWGSFYSVLLLFFIRKYFKDPFNFFQVKMNRNPVWLVLAQEIIKRPSCLNISITFAKEYFIITTKSTLCPKFVDKSFIDTSNLVSSKLKHIQTRDIIFHSKFQNEFISGERIISTVKMISA